MDRITPISSTSVGSQKTQHSQDAQKLFSVAQDLEAVFLSEMLKAAKFGEMSEVMNGGIGEDQLSSFLRDEQAKSIAQAQSTGLAEALFQSMSEVSNVVTK